MILGKIFGKVTTKEFKFIASQEVKKFEYIQIYHAVYDYVLAQIIELEKNQDQTTALCQIIGYLDKKDNKVKSLRIPLEPNTEVLLAQDDFIKKLIKLDDNQTSAYMGKLDGKDIDVYIDLKKILTKHLAVLAKSGSGKSYTVGVLLEEIIEKKVPLLIIDPHGEYQSLNIANTNQEEKQSMAKFNITPRSYPVQEYSDTKINLRARPLKLSDKLTPNELIEMIPIKLSNNQLGLLHNAINETGSCDLSEIIATLNMQETPLKWNIIGAIEQLTKLDLFSPSPTPYHELIKSGSASIINLRGIDPDIQDIIVYKITKDLFELRKKNKIPPFFLVIEEAHNFAPERSFGEKKSSKVIRTIASEGRKFGLGLCVISQRPARIDKSVISQCSTQIIMKVTNPNDLKAITSSVEGITYSTEKEIQNLSIGTALITGITDVPLFVNIRPRKTEHGGHSVDMLTGSQETNNQKSDSEDTKDIFEELNSFQKENILPIISPSISVKDIILMSEKKIKKINKILIPSFLIKCKEKDTTFDILIDRTNNEVITNIDEYQTKKIPALDKLTKKELSILQIAFHKKTITQIDLIKKLGTNIDIKDDLNKLIQKEYIIKKSEINYEINTKYIFSSLLNCQTFKTIEFQKQSYDLKKEPKYSIDNSIELLQKFTTVIDNSDVFVLKYEIEYE